MAEIFLGTCRYCKSDIIADEKEIENRNFITCKCCREKLAITEFESEQLKYRRKLEEGEKAKQALAEAEKARKAEQEKVWKIISDMDGLKGSLEEQELQLEEILKASRVDQETQESILSLLQVMNHDQQHGQKSILTVLDRIADGQDTAQGKLSAIQSATAVLTEEHADILKAISEITGLLHTDIEQKNQATFELVSWFNNRTEEDQERLKQLNTISMTLLKGQEKSAAEISHLRKTAEETQKTLKSLEGKMDQQKREALVNLYHQAENLQLDMVFDKAEDEYRKVIVNGGKDPEVYWRIILCHYGVVYQKDNEGNRIPTILRPDLSPTLSAVQELKSSCRTKEEREYYTPELKRITDLLDKYRHCQMAAQYDVFISVKQKMHYNGQEGFTKDYGIGGRLYKHLTEKELRVFNSEQEDCKKPGEEWEPYILAALLSSKVMIVVGTSKENMESQWVQNEWQRFQWLQAEDIKKTGRTDRKLLCFINGMTAYELPRGLAPIQAIIDEGGALQQLDQAIRSSFPNPGIPPEQLPGRQDGADVESIRSKMHNWLTFKKFDLVQAEYQKVISEGVYSLDVMINLYNICAEHKLNKVEELETVTFDLEKEEIVQIMLENSKDQDGLMKLQELLKKNKENMAHETHSRIRRKRFPQMIIVCLLIILSLSFLPGLIKKLNPEKETDTGSKEQRNVSNEVFFAPSDTPVPSAEDINTPGEDVTGDGTTDSDDAALEVTNEVFFTPSDTPASSAEDIHAPEEDTTGDGTADSDDAALWVDESAIPDYQQSGNASDTTDDPANVTSAAKHYSIKNAWIGITLKELNQEDAANGWPGRGMLITEVVQGSPADEAGLQAGDIIIAADVLKITGQNDFKAWLDRKKAGETSRLKLLRPSVFSINSDQTYTFNYPSKAVWVHLPLGSDKTSDDSFSVISTAENDRMRITWIGITLKELDQEDAANGWPGRGMLITEVVQNSPAGEAGLQAGDIIIAADVLKITGQNDFKAWLDRKKAGEASRFKLLRPSEFSINSDQTYTFHYPSKAVWVQLP